MVVWVGMVTVCELKVWVVLYVHRRHDRGVGPLCLSVVDVGSRVVLCVLQGMQLVALGSKR
jgi:hypothetical protein